MQKPKNLKAEDKFRVIERFNHFNVGEIITLKEDDESENPYFWKEDKSDYWSIYFSKLEPYPKTVRDAQVDDVVVEKDDGGERMVLERWQNTVGLSSYSAFKEFGETMTLDDLEKYYTLKDAPEVEQTILTMDQIAEKFGVDVSNLKIAKE